MEPQRQLRGIGGVHAAPNAVEAAERVRDVLEGVVVTMRLRVGAVDLTVRGGGIRARPEPAPERAPRLEGDSICRHRLHEFTLELLNADGQPVRIQLDRIEPHRFLARRRRDGDDGCRLR